jgi:3-phenylpropionate/cinnamic acid dioxygenase small subunit
MHDYAAALDEKRYNDWPEFFVEDAFYKVQARENFDRQLPLALIALESKGMMKDRVYGITQTIYHGPYYMRHVVSPAMVMGRTMACDPRAGELRCIPHQARRSARSTTWAATSTSWCAKTVSCACASAAVSTTAKWSSIH